MTQLSPIHVSTNGKRAEVSKRTMPGTASKGALAGLQKREDKSAAAAVEQMDLDYQVTLARLTLKAVLDIVPVSVSVETEDQHAKTLAADCERLWKETFSRMQDAIRYGRVAFEKVYGYLDGGVTVMSANPSSLPGAYGSMATDAADVRRNGRRIVTWGPSPNAVTSRRVPRSDTRSSWVGE